MEFLNNSTQVKLDEKGKEIGRTIVPYTIISGKGFNMKVCLSALPENKGKFWDIEGKCEIDRESITDELWNQIRMIKKTGPGGREDYGILLPEEVQSRSKKTQ